MDGYIEIYGWTYKFMDGFMKLWMNLWNYGWIYKFMDGFINLWMDL